MLDWLLWEAGVGSSDIKIREFHKSNRPSVYSGKNPASTNIMRIMRIMIRLHAKADSKKVNKCSTDFPKAASVPTKHGFGDDLSQKVFLRAFTLQRPTCANFENFIFQWRRGSRYSLPSRQRQRPVQPEVIPLGYRHPSRPRLRWPRLIAHRRCH